MSDDYPRMHETRRTMEGYRHESRHQFARACAWATLGIGAYVLGIGIAYVLEAARSWLVG